MGTFLLLRKFFYGGETVNFCLTDPHCGTSSTLTLRSAPGNRSFFADRHRKVRQSEDYFMKVYIYFVLVVTVGTNGEVCEA